jgi:hypothetical protein
VLKIDTHVVITGEGSYLGQKRFAVRQPRSDRRLAIGPAGTQTAREVTHP